MNFKALIFFILSFCAAGYLKAQTNSNAVFASYAHSQDSLMVQAYNKKDVKAYNKLLDNFLPKYEKLSKEDKKYFSNYYWEAYYNLCCTYSLMNDKKNALDCLEKAIKAGYTGYAHMKEDTDLDNIRNEERFKTLLQPLRETSDYLYIIKKAGAYNTQEKRDLPTFTYQPATNANLMLLRKSFNLDSIAGTGNEVSKILNLLHWIHNLIPHDGNNDNPVVKNAMSLITVCKQQARGLNCRGLATVLNECYLSMGIKSRFITCLPKDSLQIDNDCHVINLVYAESLKKWLWIDPTFDAYVMNEKGELLSIQEVRQRIIDDKPLIINPEANWNHKASETINEYLYNYMAKNLYLLECPLSSEYDLETRQPGKVINYITLVPLEYFKKSLDKTSSTETANNTTLVNYKTNNPDTFWQTP